MNIHKSPNEFCEQEIIVLDKDGTITLPNRPITKEMSSLLVQLIQERTIVILTARDMACCTDQIIKPIQKNHPNASLSNLHIGSSNGAEIWSYQDKKYQQVSISEHANNANTEDFNLVSTCKNIHDIIQKTFPKAKIEIRGNFFVGIPCIPRSTNTDEREKFDPDKSKRMKLIQKLRPYFPSYVELIPGGQTTIDISVIDKEYGMRHVMQYFNIQNPENIHYFGDAFDGGNDEPVKNIDGIHIYEISSPSDTAEDLDALNRQ